MKKILTVFGTRPEAIKMAPVALALDASPDFEHEICVTAQHREMLDQVMRIFDLKADYDLNVMKPGQDLFELTGRIVNGMKSVLEQAKPDLILVHGDTTTCFAAGLAAFYAGVSVGHVEAGLRTGDLLAPFPEEANRSLVGRLATWHFAPTEQAKRNLIAENIPQEKVFVTGNTVIDALYIAREKANSLECKSLESAIGRSLLERLESKRDSGRTILITGHRRENFGQGFVDLCNAIKSLAVDDPSLTLIYPVHLNPNVQKPVNDILSGIDNVFLIEPLDYLPFVWLMDQSCLILTDSGGIQEEGPSLGKPVLVMREVTERPEAIDAGTVKLVGTNTQSIIEGVRTVLNDVQVYESMTNAVNPFGNGTAAKQISEILAGR